jgi:hypothetical protein
LPALQKEHPRIRRCRSPWREGREQEQAGDHARTTAADAGRKESQEKGEVMSKPKKWDTMTPEEQEEWRETNRERNRKWRRENPERAKELGLRSKTKYREKYNEKQKIKRRANPEKTREEYRNRYEKTIEKCRESARNYARRKKLENPEKVREAQRKWRQSRPEYITRKQKKEWESNNPEEVLKIRKQKRIDSYNKWRVANIEKAREAARRYGKKSRANNPSIHKLANRRHVESASDSYLAYILKIKTSTLKQYPELIKAKREQIKALRQLKQQKEKQHHEPEPVQPARSPRKPR